MTARVTDPFATLLLGMASLTDTVMMSPRLAYFLLDPPAIRMQ